MTLYRFIGSHQEDDHSGAFLTPGQKVDYDADALGADRTKQLIDDGKLIKIDEEPQLTGDALEKRAQELDIKNRSKMSAEELRAAVDEAEAQQGGSD
jgi:hypothetical protein